MSPITTNVRLQQAAFFATKSLTAMLKSLVTTSIRLQEDVSSAFVHSLSAGPSVFRGSANVSILLVIQF